VAAGRGRGETDAVPDAGAMAVGDGAAFVVGFGDRPVAEVAAPVVADPDALATPSEPLATEK
ncbi:hypothetical protein DJ68_14060, partial [Halorubrum sp. C3]